MNLSGVDNLSAQLKKNQLGEIIEALQKLQDDFTNLHHIYGYCYLKSMGQVTQLSVSTEEEAYLEAHFPEDKRRNLSLMFTDGNLENVITQYMDDDYLLLQGMAIRGQKGELLGVWIMMAIIKERIPGDMLLPSCLRLRSEEGLDELVLLIGSLTSLFIKERERGNLLSANLGEIESSEKQMEALLRRNSVMTEILKMLESENDFVKTAEDVLRETGTYLGISSCSLLRLNGDDTTVDMVAEWAMSQDMAMQPTFGTVEKESLPFMTGRPFTVSSETMITDEFMEFFRRYDISAGIFLPVMTNGRAGMYLCFSMRGGSRKWTLEEVKFLNDVKKVLQSILDKRITNNSLASSYETIEQILQNSGCGIAVIDMVRQRFLYTNDTFREMVYEESDRYDLDGILIHTVDLPQEKMEYQAIHEKKWFEISFGAIDWIDGRNVRLCTIYDITESKNYQKRMEHQANVDYMTGLLNRKRLEADLSAELRLTKRNDGIGALIYMDLDDFKNINDGLGHEIGDRLLLEVAQGLERIAGVRINSYRVGGDEFALIIPHDRMGELTTILDKLRRLFESPWKLGGKEYYCTTSAGIVQFPKDGDDVNILLRRADYALREAKGQGKSRFEYYSDETSENTILRLDMERALRSAVENGCREFKVYYQPLVDITKEGTPCVGAEALVRWKSAALGLVMPSDFVPLAEYLGLIVPIGEHVLYEACARCRYWNDFGHPEYKVNVNLSVIQLLQGDIVDTVRQALVQTGVNPKNVTLEVTESLAISDLDSMMRILESLRDLGVRVALDDFGTGYSSLSYIRSLPLDTIKIDKTFVNHVGEDDFSDAFVETVSKLADSIHVDVVVEGVEEKVQAEALKGMDVSIIQGFLYDKPLSQEDFEAKYLI